MRPSLRVKTASWQVIEVLGFRASELRVPVQTQSLVPALLQNRDGKDVVGVPGPCRDRVTLKGSPSSWHWQTLLGSGGPPRLATASTQGSGPASLPPHKQQNRLRRGGTKEHQGLGLV